MGPQGFSTSMGEKCQLLLSDKIRGYFLVPENNTWNYSFMGSAFGGIEKKPVHVKIDTPLPFYSGQHRPLHFQNFAELYLGAAVVVVAFQVANDRCQVGCGTWEIGR